MTDDMDFKQKLQLEIEDEVTAIGQAATYGMKSAEGEFSFKA